MSTQVSEQQARQVAEAAREQEWKLPSFGKELFLGNFRLDLIHPQPKLDAAAVEKGEAFLGRAARVPRPSTSTRSRSSATSKIPDDVDRRPQDARRARHEGARAVRRPRPLAGLLQPGARAGRHLALLAGHAALGAPVDRRRRAADAVRLRGAEAEVAAARWPRTTSPPSCSPSPTSAPTRRASARPPRRPRTARLPAQRPQAVGDQRRDRRHRRRHGQGPQGARAARAASARSSSTTRPTASPSRAATQFMGLRGIENSVTAARGRLRAEGEPDRQARARA